MPSEPASGTEGYAEEADALVRQYESIAFADVHASVSHLFPASPGRVLDIGSGTGRDAAGFATLGHQVLAVEPTAALRTRAAALHPSQRIAWLDDSLPDLPLLRRRGEVFDLVMLTAVWMHLDPGQRAKAMPRVASLVRVGGTTIMSLRHGPVPPGRRMFDVGAEETSRLAAAEGLDRVLTLELQDSRRRQGVSWTRVAFTRPGAGG